MVKARLWILLALLCLLTACTSRHATPAELPLLFAPTTEKYWICNFHTKDTTAPPEHYNLLLTYSPTDQGSYTTFFFTHCNAKDSTFHYGLKTSAQTIWSKPEKWPLMAHIPGDSGNIPWRIYLGKKALWMDGGFQDAPTNSVSIRGALHPKGYFPAAEVRKHVHALPPLIYRYRVGKQKTMREGWMHLTTFTEGGHHLHREWVKAWYWLSLDGEINMWNALLIQDNSGHISLLRVPSDTVKLGQSLFPEVHATRTDEHGTWQSAHSHKTYSLGIKIQFKDEWVYIRPRIRDQEVRAGKNSFWMGAVEAVDSGGVPLSTGNMYIFTR